MYEAYQRGIQDAFQGLWGYLEWYITSGQSGTDPNSEVDLDDLEEVFDPCDGYDGECPSDGKGKGPNKHNGSGGHHKSHKGSNSRSYKSSSSGSSHGHAGGSAQQHTGHHSPF
jgi:hypothetical protein